MAKTRTTLTKSLHTVSAVTRVALYLARQSGADSDAAPALVADALDMLGHDASAFVNDPTVERCIGAVRDALDIEAMGRAMQRANAARLHAAVSGAVGAF